MIYFLINNNYHWYDVKLHLIEIKKAGMEVGLIQIPHTLEPIVFHENINKIHLFNSPFIGSKNFWNPIKIFNTHKVIESELTITQDDILLIYTEEEFLNQFVLMQFKKQKAKVFLLDEGWQSILTYSKSVYTGYPVKWIIKSFYLRYIIGYKILRLNYLNEYVYPQVFDEFINGVFCFRHFKMQRQINQMIIKRDVEVISNLNERDAVFLSQPLYEIYISYEEYFSIIDNILGKLSIQFENIYFKFHPREHNTKLLEEHIMRNYTNVIFIHEKIAIEEIISYYKPKYAISFQSVSLLNLNDMGMIPIYCFKDFDNLSKCKDFIMIEEALNAMNYVFPENLGEITNSICGFKFKESINLSLTQYLIKESNFANK